jgi:hypothetical protein
MMEDEECYDDDDEEEQGGILLSINGEGKAELYNPDDFVEVNEKDFEIIQGFLKEHKEQFKEYCEKNSGKE